MEHVLFSMIKSANFLDIGHYGVLFAVGDEYLFICSLDAEKK